MKSVRSVKSSIMMQQCHLLRYIGDVVYSSGNINGIPQWLDRSKLYKLTDEALNTDYLFTQRDFEFLERLHLKYKF